MQCQPTRNCITTKLYHYPAEFCKGANYTTLRLHIFTGQMFEKKEVTLPTHEVRQSRQSRLSRKLFFFWYIFRFSQKILSTAEHLFFRHTRLCIPKFRNFLRQFLPAVNIRSVKKYMYISIFLRERTQNVLSRGIHILGMLSEETKIIITTEQIYNILKKKVLKKTLFSLTRGRSCGP